MGLPVVKDLVVDMEPFFAQFRSVLPYLINDARFQMERERVQSVEDRERFDDTTKCILCAACTTSCPAFWANGTSWVRPRSSTPTASSSTRATGGGRRAAARSSTSAPVYGVPHHLQLHGGLPARDPHHQAIGEVKKAILYGQVA
jgi:succinate dehydrogenase/fumarate reductase-like Fe-S protein